MAVVDQARRQLAAATGDARRWLQINLLRGLIRSPGWRENQDDLAQARTVAYDLLDQARRLSLSADQREQVVIQGLDVAQALDLAGFGETDAGGGLMDEFIVYGRESYPAQTSAPDRAVCRLRYMEADRELTRWMQEIGRLDPIAAGATDPLPVWMRILELAKESAGYATADLLPEPLSLLAQVSCFIARKSGTASSWADVLSMSREALANIPVSDPTYCTFVITAAAALNGISDHAPDLGSALGRLAEAEDVCRKALDTRSDPGSEDRGNLLVELADARFRVSRLTGDAAAAHEGARLLLEAAGEAGTWVAAAHFALAMTEQVDQIVMTQDDEDDVWRRYAGQACLLGIDGALRAAARGRTRAERQAPLSQLSHLAGCGAEYLLEAGDVDRAVHALERGRLVAFTASLEAQSLEKRLHEIGAAALADEIGRHRNDLEAAEFRLGVGSPARVAEADAARRLRARVAELEGEARDLVGAAPTADLMRTVREVSSDVPVLYVVAGGAAGYAILARGDQPLTWCRLPDLVLSSEDDGLVPRTHRFRGARATIGEIGSPWPGVLQETIDWLRAVVARPLQELLDGVDEVALTPVGLLAQLPLHAVLVDRAEAQGGAGRVVRQVAGATALDERTRRAHGNALDRVENLLAVAVTVPGPDEAGALDEMPDAVAQARTAVAAFPSATAVTLFDEEATTGRVVAALPRADVVHVSCHGTADPEDPLAGGLILADRRLSLRELLPLDLTATRLAVIAACETSVTHPYLQDELTGLATGLTEVGVSGVVATMWQVPKQAAHYLCARFYHELALAPGSPAAALTRAQAWLRVARQADLDEFPPPTGRHRRVGSPPDRQRFAHPDSWAAFAYYGV